MTVNTPNMPVKSPADDIFNTSADYDVKIVSYGDETYENYYDPLTDGTKIDFTDNILKGFARLDERNLMNCQQLNLDSSSLTSLCTIFLSNLRVLSLVETKITSLVTHPSKN